MTVLRYLKKGKHKAIPGITLAELIYSIRAHNYEVRVQEEIRALRLIGCPIVGCRQGYYLARDYSEVKAFTDTCEKRAKVTLKMCAMMRRMISKFNGQKKLLLKK